MSNEHQGLQAADFPAEWQPVEDPSFPINMNIHVACDEPDELLQHLNVISNQIRKYLRNSRNLKKHLKQDTARLLDNNCYGTHAVDINFNTKP